MSTERTPAPRSGRVIHRLTAARRHVGGSLRVLRAILRNPSMRRVEVAFLLFNATEFGTWVAVLLYAYGATGPASVGLVALVQLLPAGLFAPLAATLADRYPRERVLAASYAVQAVALGATAAGMALGAEPVLVYALSTASVAAMTITRPTQGSLLPGLARTPEELTAANGMSGTIEGAGVLLGPLGAAAILTIGTPAHVLGAGTLACVVAVLLVARLPHVRRATRDKALVGEDPGHEPHRQGLLAGIRALSGNADSRLIVALLGLAKLTSGAMDILFVLLALEVFMTGEAGAGILTAALGLGTIVGGGATFALVGRPSLAPALALSAVAWGAAILAVGTFAPAWAAPAAIAIGGIGYAAADVTGRMILQRVTPDRELAGVLGGLEGIGLIGLSIGSVLVPVSAAVFGISTTLIATGTLLPLGVGAAWLGLRRIDRRVTVPVRELALLRSMPTFAPLPAPEIERVARQTRWVTLDPGEVLIREGDVGHRYFVLESGRVRVTRQGVERRVAEGPGYGLGEIALLRDIRRTATVTAVDPCVLLALEREDFIATVTGHDLSREMAERHVAQHLESDSETATPG